MDITGEIRITGTKEELIMAVSHYTLRGWKKKGPMVGNNKRYSVVMEIQNKEKENV